MSYTRPTSIRAVFVSLGLFLAITSFAQAEKPKLVRHFMQGDADLSGITQYGNNPSAGHYAQSGDAKIYYEVYGTGEPVVTLHGGVFGSTFELYQFIDRLSKDHQVIAISTRGHGKSDIGSSPATLDQRVADVMAVVDQVTKEKVTILGFSDGAYTGYGVASKHPDRVKKLIAMGAGEQVPGLRKVVLDAKAAYGYDPAYWDQQLAMMPEPKRLDEYWHNLENFYNTMVFSKELFASIKCPVLVLAGEKDMNAPLATVIAAYQMIPNSQLSIIPNTPHPVFLVNFPAVWEAIEPFLKQ